jgi:HEAT repeat protein
MQGQDLAHQEQAIARWTDFIRAGEQPGKDLAKFFTANAIRDATQSASPAVRAGALLALPLYRYGEPVGLLIGALQDPVVEVRKAAVGALREFSQGPDPGDGYVGPAVDGLVRALGGPDAGVREAAVHALGEFGQTHPKADASTLGLAVDGLATVLADGDPALRTAAVGALGRFGQTQPAPVVSALAGAIKDEEAGVRRAALEVLPGADPDAASELVPAVTGALGDVEPGVQLAALDALAWFGPEAARSVRAVLNLLVGDPDKSVRERAAQVALRIAPWKKLARELKGLTGASARAEVLRILRALGEQARDLRRALEAASERGQEGVADSAASGQPGRPSRRPALRRWAVGIEHQKQWQVFENFKGKWRPMGLLRGLKGGVRAKLLEGFARNGGWLSKLDALEIVGGPSRNRPAASTLMAAIKPELSKLRKILLKAFRVQEKVDPLPWDEGSESWQAVIGVGYAVEMDSAYASGPRRLRFKTRDQLNSEE